MRTTLTERMARDKAAREVHCCLYCGRDTTAKHKICSLCLGGDPGHRREPDCTTCRHGARAASCSSLSREIMAGLRACDRWTERTRRAR